MKRIITTTVMFSLLAGCTEQQQPPAYVSPLEFKNYNCKQIAKEMAYTSSQLSGATATNQTNEVLGAAIVAYGISQG